MSNAINTPAILRDSVLAAVTAEYALLFGKPRDEQTVGYRNLFLGATVDAVIAFHSNPRDPKAVAAMAAEMTKGGQPMWVFAEKALLEQAPRRGVRTATVTDADLAVLGHAVRVRAGRVLADASKAATVGRDAKRLLAHADNTVPGPTQAELQAKENAWALERMNRPFMALADAQAQADEATRKRRAL